MNSTTAQTYPLKSEPNTRAAIRFIVTGSIAIAATLLFFWLRGRHEGMVRYWDPERAAPVFAFSLAMAVAFAWVRYRDTAAIFLSLTRITAAGVLVYLIVEPPSFTNANDRASLIQFVNDGYWVALAAAALSLWRPSFLFPAALYAISTRYIASAISGFEISTLDIRYMMEMAQFLSCCACGLVVLRWISGRSIGRQPLELIDQNSLAMSLAFVAIGFHLGNYFWSGYEKLLLGPHPWSWVLVNETQNIMAGALKKGVLPTGAFPTITQWLYAGLGFFVIPMNFAVLAVQLFAIVAALRIRWLIVASLAYDAFHVGIYIFGGLFFWPWIWNNASIIICLRNRTDAEIGWLPKLCCIATVISGFSLHLAASARLAWFDVLDFKTPTI